MPPAAPLTLMGFVKYAFTAATLFMSVTKATLGRGRGRGHRAELQMKDIDKGRLVTTRSTSETVRLNYGKVRVGGNQVFVTTTGADNKYLHLIITLGEGEVNKIAQVGGIDQIFLDGVLYTQSDFAGSFYYEFFNGSKTQNVCATLKTAYPSFTDPMRHTVYLYCRFIYDREKFASVPDVTVVLEGMKVKDFTTQDDYNLMPMLYTDNLAYCVYDFITRSSVRGGKEICPARIDVSSFREAASYYTTYGWTCNMPVDRDQSVEDNLTMMLANGRSEIIYSDGKFKLKFRDTRVESVVMQIGEDDIIQSGKESTMEIVPASTLFRRPNAIKASFISADKNYHQDEKVFRDDAAYNTEGDYRELAIELLGLSSLSKVIPMSYYYLERARWGNMTSLTMGNRGISLEPMDLVEITHRMPGWTDTAKPMYRVEEVVLQPDGNVALALLQETDALYDDTFNADLAQLFITDLLSPSALVQSVVNVSHTEEVYFYRGRSFTRWKINFDPPAVTDYPFWDYAEIWLKIGTGTYKFMTKATADYQLDPVEEGVLYTIKIRSVSIFGVKENFASAFTASQTILGKVVLPNNMLAITAIAAGDTVSVYGDEVADPDISGYEIRLGGAWAGGVFMAFNETPNFRLTGVKPGTHTFWCKAKDNSGNYSSVAVSATVIVFYPPGYSDKNIWSWNYNAIGVHNNTQHVVYDGSDCLKCSHTLGVLTGVWTSPEYDLGMEKDVRIWGDFLTVFTSSATSWGGIFPGTTAWNAKITSTTKWYEITTPDVAAMLEAKIRWGTSPGVYPNEADFFQILAPEFRARYIQVEIRITDPQADANLYIRTLNLKAAFWR